MVRVDKRPSVGRFCITTYESLALANDKLCPAASFVVYNHLASIVFFFDTKLVHLIQPSYVAVLLFDR